MANDIIRQTERAAVIALKGDPGVLEIVGKPSIDPQDEEPEWPFIRMGVSQALPEGRGCSSRVRTSILLHAFAKPRYNEGGGMIEIAKDHAGRLTSAITEALHQHAFSVDGRRYRFAYESVRLEQDGAERDAFHGIISLVARAFQG